MIVAGFGFRAAATLESLSDAYERARGDRKAQFFATPYAKMTDGFCAFAARQGAQVVGVRDLTAETPTKSEASLVTWNTGSVAEASALAAAGSGAQLLGPREISSDRMATCALAIGEDG